ncbi:hypothetical protein [Pseudomonas amygdali]|uniref:hypothetical protein n=1 Tax=Pseudomonas amygdali TaxID=47877 RepID=UPI000E3E1601|nr:hypothetical protein [Pseudomonas amygdali]
MGTIVEFYTAGQVDDLSKPGGIGTCTLVQSLSINSLMVEVLLDALTGTSLDPLIGDGSDSERSIFVAPADFHRLRAQSVQWSLQPGEVLREIYEAVDKGVDEAEWAKRGLLVVIR